MKALPDEVKLSREEGQALIERLQANALTSEDRGLLVNTPARTARAWPVS